MRRLYILLGAALIAATLVAVAIGPASAGLLQHKYTAIAVNEWENNYYSYSATTKGNATRAAMNACKRKSGGALDQYCEGTGWVKDGWIALFYERHYTGNQAIKNHWGFGWAENRNDAGDNARYWCNKSAKHPCHYKVIVETPARVNGPASGGAW
jgi:hypothetical protein